MRRYSFLLTTLTLIISFTQLAYSAEIKALKGKKVLVDMDPENFNVGDILKVQNNSGKTIGLVKLTKVKGRLAEGLLKGKATKGLQVQLRSKKSGAKEMSGSLASGSKSNTKPAFGVMVGYNMTTAEITLPLNAETVSLDGTGFSLKALVDYPLLNWLNFRGLAGLEQFNVGGVSNQGCDGECTAEINYLSFDLWGRYVMGSGSFRPWLGVGFELMFPISKSATALDESSITNTSSSPVAIGGGFDFWMSKKSYIPTQIEYVPYPSTDDVKASAIAARVGYSMTF